MLISQDASVSALLIFTSLFIIGAAETIMDFKTVHLQYNTSLLVDRYSFSSPGMVFGTCSPASKTKNRFCTLVLETTKPFDSADHLRVCNITVKSKVRYEEISDIDRLVAFSDNKAILVWSNQEHTKKFTIVHFDDCRTFVSKIHRDIDIRVGRIVAVADDIFDIIEPYNTQYSCKHSEFCKLTMDDEGNVITGFSAWGNRIFADTLVDVVHSPLKGRLIVDANSWMTKVRVLSEYNFKILKTYNNHFRTRLLLRTPAISKTHGRLTVCYEYDFSSFLCSQFDWNGQLKFEILLDIHTTLETVITVHNLPDGGFLLINGAFYFDNIFCQNCLNLAKIDAKGNKVGHKDFIFVFPYRYRFDFRQLHFHVNENRNYCLSHPFEEDKNDGLKVTLTFACFYDSDLTAA